MSVLDYSTTPASNTSINSIGIAGTNSPANFDNALRQLMADIADTIAGNVVYKDTFTLADPADTTKKFRFDGGNVTAGQTRVITIPDGNITLTGNIPASNDGAALGASGTAWSDLFLASGGVINWDAGDVTITHSANTLAFAGASSGYTFDAPVTVSGAFSIGTSNALTAGTIELGAASDTTISRSAAGVIAVEGLPLYSGIPITDKSAAYTLVLGDRQTAIRHPAADTNNRTFTIDSNANVAYPIGTVLTFINEVNTVTIAITSDTMVLAVDGTTGSRTLAANGIATAIKVASTRWYISGVGLT